MHQGVIRADGSGQYASSRQDAAPALSGSVMATLANNVGSQRIDPSSTVELPGGMRTSLASAEALGYIRRNANGTYEDAVQAPANEQPQEQQQGYQPELAPAAEEVAYGEVIADIRQDSYDAAAALAATAVVDESDAGWLSIANRLAASEGISPDAAAEKVEKAHAFFTKQADRVCESKGIADPDAFYEWAQMHKPQELTAAVQSLVGIRSTKGFADLAVQFKTLESNASLAQWRSAGFDAYTDRATGEVMVSLQGRRAVPARELK